MAVWIMASVIRDCVVGGLRGFGGLDKEGFGGFGGENFLLVLASVGSRAGGDNRKRASGGVYG